MFSLCSFLTLLYILQQQHYRSEREDRQHSKGASVTRLDKRAFQIVAGLQLEESSLEMIAAQRQTLQHKEK